MAVKKKAQKYTVDRRYSVWMSREIEAESFDDAVVKAKELGIDDFLTVNGAVEFLDSEQLPGFGVRETF